MPIPKNEIQKLKYNPSGKDKFVIDFLNKYKGKKIKKDDVVQTYRRFGQKPDELIQGLYEAYAPENYSPDRAQKLKKDYSMDQEQPSMVQDILEKKPTSRDYTKLPHELPEATRKIVLGDKAKEYSQKHFKKAMESSAIEPKVADQVFRNVSEWYKEKGGVNPYEAMFRFNHGLKNLNQQYENLSQEAVKTFTEKARQNPSDAQKIKEQYSQYLQDLEQDYDKSKEKLANDLNLQFKEEEVDGQKEKRVVIPEAAWDTYYSALDEQTKKIFENKEKQAQHGYWKSFYEGLKLGGKRMLEIGNNVLASSEQIHNDIFGDDEDYWGRAQEYRQWENQKIAQEYQYFDKRASEYLEAGELGKTAAAALQSSAQELPRMVGLAITQMAGLPVLGLGLMGFQKSSERLLELSDRDDLSTFQKYSESITWGLNEIVFEKMGTLNIIKNVQKRMAKQGIDVTEKAIMKEMRPWFIKVMGRGVNFAKPGVQEGLEEVGTAISDDIATKLTSNPDKKIGETAIDDFLVGMTAGKVISMPADISSVYRDVAGDTEKRYIRRTLKRIPDHYDINSKVEALQLKAKQDILENRRNSYSGEFSTVPIDREIEKIRDQLAEIDDREVARTEQEPSVEQPTQPDIQPQEQPIKKGPVSAVYNPKRDAASYTSDKVQINVSKPVMEKDYSVTVSVKDSSTSTGYRVRKDMSKNFSTLEEALEYADKIAKKGTESVPQETQSVEDVVPQQVQDFSQERGYKNIHEALNSVRKRVDEDITPEQLTEELIERAVQDRETEQQVDQGVEEAQQRLDLSDVPDVTVNQQTEQTLDKLEKGEPVVNERLQAAENDLYGEYKRLERLKRATNRKFTVPQIEAMQEAIGEEITDLNEFKKQQDYEGQFKNFKEFKEKAEVEVETEAQQTPEGRTVEDIEQDRAAEVETLPPGKEVPPSSQVAKERKAQARKKVSAPKPQPKSKVTKPTKKAAVKPQPAKTPQVSEAVERNTKLQGYENVDQALKSVQKNVDENATLETLTKEQIAEAAIKEGLQERQKRQTEQVEPSKKVESNIQKFSEDFNGDRVVADPRVQSARNRAQKYLDEHGQWLSQNSPETHNALTELVNDPQPVQFKTYKERDQKASQPVKETKQETTPQVEQQIPDEVQNEAREQGYENMEDLYKDYVQYGAYKGKPKPRDMVVSDVKSIQSRKRQAEQEPAKEKKTKTVKQTGPEATISNTLDDLENQIIQGTINSFKEAPTIEGKSIGQYLIDNKNNLSKLAYEGLRNRLNSISKSISAIKQGDLDAIPNAKIKRGLQGQISAFEQAQTKVPQKSREFLQFTVNRLLGRMPNIKVRYDTNLKVPAKFTKDGIVINPNKAGGDTPIHEFAHPYVMMMKNQNPELYSVGKALVRDAGVVEEVKRDMSKLKDETDEQFEARAEDEAMVKVIGEQGANIAAKKYGKRHSKIRNWVEEMWNWIKKQLGILPRYDVSTITVDQFGKLVARDLFNTQPLTENNAESIIEADIIKEYQNIALDNGGLLFSRQGKTNFDVMAGWLARGIRTKSQAPSQIKLIEMLKSGAVKADLQELRLNMLDFHNYFRNNYMKTRNDPNNPFNGLTRKDVGAKLNGIMMENIPMENMTEELNEAEKQAQRYRILKEYGFPEDAALLEKILNLRSTIDKLSKELITSGLVDSKLAGIINANLGIYLTRSFQAHKSKKWTSENIPMDIRQRARRRVRYEHNKGAVESVDYSWNDQDNLDFTVNTMFSGQFKIKNLTKAKAMNLFNIDKSLDPFKKEDGSFTLKTPVDIGWKTDSQGKFFNERFRTLSDLGIDNMLDQLVNSNIQEALFRGKGKGFSKSQYLGILMKRKEIPDEILEFMGVENDAYVRLYDSVKKMANLLANHKALEQMRDVGMDKFLWRNRDDAPRGAEKISADQSESYSPLNGLWARPETIRYLKKVDDPKNVSWMMKSIMKFNGIVKGGFTIWNNVTQLRNLISWAAIHASNGTFNFSDINDHWRIALQDMGYYRSRKEFRDWHNKLIGLHVLHENADFNDFQNFVRESETKPQRYFSDNWMLRMGKVGQLMDAAARRGRSTERFVEQLYRLGDDLNKTIYFFNTLKTYEEAFPEMDKEKLYQQVAEITIKTTPTYSDLPAVIRWLRRTPIVGAFVSWPTAMIKSSVGSFQTAMQEINSGNQTLERKGYRRLLGSMMFSTPIAGMIAQWTSMLWSGMDDDEADKLEAFLAPWNQNTYKIFLPSAEPGSYRFVPASYIDPYNYTNRIITALLRHPDEQHRPIMEALNEIMEPYLGADILFGVFNNVNTDINSGKGKIVNPTDNLYNQAKDIIGYFLNELKPGVIRNALRVYKATTEQKDLTKYGTRYRLGNEVITNLSGFRITETDVRQSLFYKTLEYQKTVNNIRNAYRKVKYDPQKANSTVEKEFYEYNKQAREEFDKMKEMVYSTRSQLGLTNKEILKILNDAELPEWMIRDFKSGSFSGMYKDPTEKLREDLRERQ